MRPGAWTTSSAWRWSTVRARQKACCAGRHPSGALRSGLWQLGPSPVERLEHPMSHGRGVPVNLEIPETQHRPASLREGLVLPRVASDVPLDLLVPVARPSARLPLTRVSVPERAVDEHGDLPAREGDVDPAARPAPVGIASHERRARQSALRSSRSGFVSVPRIAAMIRRRPGDEAGGERSVSELPAISLFSGAGGLDLGVERAGYAIRASVEYRRATRPRRCARTFPTLNGARARHQTLAGDGDPGGGGAQARARQSCSSADRPARRSASRGNWLEYKRTGLDPDASLLDHYLRVLAEAAPTDVPVSRTSTGSRTGTTTRPGSKACSTRRAASATTSSTACSSRPTTACRSAGSDSSSSARATGCPTFPSRRTAGRTRRVRSSTTTLTPHVTTGDAIGDLAGRDDLAEQQEVVNGKYGHLLPEIPPGDNYLYFTAKRGHPEPLFEWRKRYWSFLLKLDPNQPSPTIQAQPGPYVGPFHWHNRRLRLPEILRLQTLPRRLPNRGSRDARRRCRSATPCHRSSRSRSPAVLGASTRTSTSASRSPLRPRVRGMAADHDVAGRSYARIYRTSGKANVHDFLSDSVARAGGRLLYMSPHTRAPIFSGWRWARTSAGRALLRVSMHRAGDQEPPRGRASRPIRFGSRKAGETSIRSGSMSRSRRDDCPRRSR